MRRLKNMTITVEEEVLLWARVWAARKGTSVSRLVGGYLRRAMREEEGYEAAMQEYLSVPARDLSGGRGYPRREELYDRGRIR